MSAKIPFLDLVTPHVELENELVEIFRKAILSAGFIGGPMLESFERDFATFCGTTHSVGLNSGTDAVRFALMAAGVREGDVVVTVPNTFIATTEAISQAGATPEFVDVDDRTYNMDPKCLREYLESKCDFDRTTGRLVSRRSRRPVTAVVPVHLYGQMADMDPIVELCEKYGLILIEDACQAHGAEYFSRKTQSWRRAGTIGRAAAFSFYPGKNLGACGEAGAITTNDGDIAAKVRMIRDHGQVRKYYHDVEGYNGRLDSIQAGILHLKLGKLSGWNDSRRELALEYNRLLETASESLTTPFEPSWSRGVYHLYVVGTQDRDGLMAHLNSVGIGTGIHYPIPLHLQKAYASLGYQQGSFPISEKAATSIVSLPMFPNLTAEQQKRVAVAVLEFVGAKAGARAMAAAGV
jgi:dTDP-4-amino-4,6-dideoxygalactose transaminase